ncbi:hypothetical protein N2152v2_008538 [Parachlorella kessleri]
MSVTFLQPVEVRALLKGPDREKVLVVDVRDDDFGGGHIAGCVHFPVNRFHSDYDLDAFIEEYIQQRQHLETVVVHCYLSQQRGPLCARRQLYGDDPELVADDDDDESQLQ